MTMTFENFLQGAAIYLAISILAVYWFVKICDGEKNRKAKKS